MAAPLPAATVPELAFAVQDAGPLPRAAAPALRFGVRVEAGAGVAVRSVLLDVQLQIAARRRPHDAASEARLFELFGPRSNWATSLATLPWTRTTVVVPPFEGETVVDVDVPCTYDLEVVSARYLAALPDGVVPLEFLFSGALFYAAADGRLQTARIAWDREAEYRLPVSVWRATMDHYFPGTAWLRIDRATHDRLCAYKSRHAHPTMERALAALLDGRG